MAAPNIKALLAVAVILVFSAVGVESMSIFKAEDVCIFSPFEARLTYKGDPAAGAEIIRHVNWKDEVGDTDVTIAGEDGSFSFPGKYGKLRQMLPSQFVAHQKIIVRYKGDEFQIWGTGKLEKHEYSELGGKPINMRCELTDPPRRVEAPAGAVGTSCVWDELK